MYKINYNINEPDKLIQYIEDKLKPDIKNKENSGEVFTPLSIINDMLDELDESYKKEHNKSIFTEKHLTWYDPCVGIGNFCIF